MKHNLRAKLLSVTLSAALLLSSPVAALKTAAESKPKYVSEVFIAYGKTEAEATQWLNDHGWEPVKGDFNAGKNAAADDPVAAVMGIHRTSNPEEAITDMAVMNMGTDDGRAYSFDDYKAVLEEKKGEINALIDGLMPALREYRDNYNGRGSSVGKARAEMAHELLNQFYDGEIDGQYAVNDTGMAIGDLLLHETRREYGEDKYAKLSKNERVQYGDLQQILIESSTPVVQSIQASLAVAADTSDDTWVERLSGVSGLGAGELAEVCIEEAGDNLADSAAESLLQSKFGDYAALLAAGYNEVRQELLWYIAYNDTNGLWMDDSEDDAQYSDRIRQYFDQLGANDQEAYNENTERYLTAWALYDFLYTVEYSGEWGDTLGEFFLPETEDGENVPNYGSDAANFLPFAAVLSDGQRATLSFVSLKKLLMVCNSDEAAIRSIFPQIRETFNANGVDQLDVYTGINRAIFRDGVALTSAARSVKNMGKSPYEDMWAWDGISTCIVAGLAVVALVGLMFFALSPTVKSVMAAEQAAIQAGIKNLATIQRQMENGLALANIGAVALVIGLVFLLAAIIMSSVKLAMYYNRDFTRIPNYIVDESDIVTYVKGPDGKYLLDEHGEKKKNIEFDQFVYYEVVKCNRQDIGINDEAQDGVDQYQEWGCGDAADLNADIGKEWLALYTVKSPTKGNPILADSLTFQYNNYSTPKGCTNPLHMFNYTNAMNVSDQAYAFNDEAGKIYFFWASDSKAFTASTFTSGHLALVGIGGLAVGALGATVLLKLSGKRKEDETPAQAV